MSSNDSNCCCTNKNKAEVCESLSRIGETYDVNYGLWANESLYGTPGTYTTGHYFKDNQNLCFGPIITDQMVAGGDARTAEEAPTGGLSYETNISSFNYRNDSKAGTVNFANCEDCLRYHITHVNTLDGDTSVNTDSDGVSFTGSYGRLYAILAQCDCNDYFQFNQDNDAGAESVFERFAWPTCKIEEKTDAGETYDVQKTLCPTGRTAKDQENYDYKTYNEASASVQDGIPDDMGHTYFYLDYTPMVEEVRESSHPNYITPNATQTGVTYNTPNHTLANPGDGTTRSVPNATLDDADKITFASDTTSKTSFNRLWGTGSRVPLNFCSGENRASTYLKFHSSNYNSVNNGTIQLIAGGVTKTYTIINTGSPSGTQFLATTSAEQTAINFKTVVEGTNGHGLDKLMVEYHGGEVYITQTAPGEAGNTTVTTAASFDNTTEFNAKNFIGGTDKSDNMTQDGDNKGTFVVMKIDPAIDGSYDTNRAVYRAFKVIGFSQYKPSVFTSHTGETDAIKELPLGHVDEIHFRMNPQDSTVYYGAESAIAEANSSSCYNQAAASSNTAQLGTGAILSGLNTGAASGSNKWQGGDPCTRSNDNAADSQGQELKVIDYGDFCKNSQYLPETITIQREFPLESTTSPWASGAISDPRQNTCLNGQQVSNFNDSTDLILKADAADGISFAPWGNTTVELGQESDAGTVLRLTFTYTRNPKASCNLVDAQSLDFGSIHPTKKGFQAPKASDRSIDPNDTEDYSCHYQLASISSNQGDIIHWVKDPYILLKDTVTNAGTLLDRRFLKDTNDSTQQSPVNGDSTIEKLFIKNNITGSGYTASEYAERQNNHQSSASIDTGSLDVTYDYSNPYTADVTRNEYGAYYRYGGYKYPIGGGTSGGFQVFCDGETYAGYGGTKITRKGRESNSYFSGRDYGQNGLSDNNDDINTTRNPLDTADALCPNDGTGSSDPIDPFSKLDARSAYVGLGIPSFAPEHYSSSSGTDGTIPEDYHVYHDDQLYHWDDGLGANAGGHTFMPTFTIGIKHSPKIDTRSELQFTKSQLGLPSTGTRDELNGENFRRFRYECSTYVIPAGLYVFRIEDADVCTDDSSGEDLNGTSATNRCVFGLSMPIPKSVHDAHIANTSNRIHPKYLQWWEGFYRSYAQPGSKAYSKDSSYSNGIDFPACIGSVTSIFQGASAWEFCGELEGTSQQQRPLTSAIAEAQNLPVQRNVCSCSSVLEEGEFVNVPYPQTACSKFNFDNADESLGTCCCTSADCEAGGGACGGGENCGDSGNESKVGDCSSSCGQVGGGEACLEGNDLAYWTTEFIGGTAPGCPQSTGEDPEPNVPTPCYCAVCEVDDNCLDTWDEFCVTIANDFCCCTGCKNQGGCDNYDCNGDGLPGGGGPGDFGSCIGENTCCNNKAGCSMYGGYWGPLHSRGGLNNWLHLDRWEIRSGIAPSSIRGTAAGTAWANTPRNTNGTNKTISGSGHGSTTVSQELFYPAAHDDVDSPFLNCDMRFIKPANPYLYTQIQYDPTNGYNNGSGTAGECGFCQGLIDETFNNSAEFFGKLSAVTSGVQTNNWSTSHGLLHVSSLVDMGCSDRDYVSLYNNNLVWSGSFTQLDYIKYTDNTSLTVAT
tara:strand:+ start:9639 stop:14492 length:4854 start_codon:yes stop_codon:yes gene_type:complete